MLSHYNAVAMLTQLESLAPDVTGAQRRSRCCRSSTRTDCRFS